VTSAIGELAHVVRPARGAPAGALVLLHGRGADERDLHPLLDELDPDRRLVGVTPRAPLELEPGGFHWYVVRRVGYPDPPTFFDAFARLSAWLDALPDALGVSWQRTVLGGFSQGAVMAYALGLGPGRPSPAGLIALSGFIPTVEGFDLDLAASRGLPVAIGHGTLDPVISVDFARAARARLEAAGLDVTYRESRMWHAIDPLFVAVLQNWLRAAVPAPERAAARRGREETPWP
jgi:phospholipase/carboxylesterase